MTRISRVLTRNALSAAGQVAVQTFILFFLYRYLIDSIGIEQLGVWAIILATASAARVSELGFSGSATKFVATYRIEGNEQYARDALETAAITLAAVLAVVLLALYPILDAVLPSFLPATSVEDGRVVLPYALISLWFSAVGGVWMASLDGYLRSDVRAGLSIICTFVYMAIVLATVPLYGLKGLAMAQVMQSALLALMGWLAVRRTAHIIAYLPCNWSRERFKDMLNYGVNFQINSLVMLLFEPTTKILFGRYGELAAAGYFEVAQRLVTRIRALIVESNRVIVPVVAELEGDQAKTEDLYSKNARLLYLMLTPLFAALLGLLPVISVLWIGSYESQFVLVATCLVIAWYVNSMTAPAYFAYLGVGRFRWITTSHVAMGSGNLLLGLALGDVFGWLGVLAAFCGSLAIGSLVPMWMYHREHGLSVAKLLSKHDCTLMLICVVSATVALTMYVGMLNAGVNGGIRSLVVFASVAGAIILGLVAHPLFRDTIAAARIGLSRTLAKKRPF